jgi:glycosyltransferase involved in cell wall biosynthesis
MLFLSRVSPGKGLLMLLDALDQSRREFEDWCLVIAGADEFDHRNEVERAIREKGFGNSVMLVGALFDQVKRDAFAAAELFVLPSFNEAGPIVVLEALGAQLPVITTKASPWPELQQRSCGWWTDMTVEALTSALKDAFSRSSSALHAMGLRGKAFVRAEHTWTKAARMNMELYGWLLGEREQPSFVETSH